MEGGREGRGNTPKGEMPLREGRRGITRQTKEPHRQESLRPTGPAEILTILKMGKREPAVLGLA